VEVLADRDLLGTRLLPPGPLEVQDRAAARRKTHQLSIVVAGGTKSKHFGETRGAEAAALPTAGAKPELATATTKSSRRSDCDGDNEVEPEVGFEPTAC
jgi:hypothetical protein